MLNKIALGTVQFGLNYGVTNLDGQVHLNEVEKILKFAKESGISLLDTASEYGNSEEVLGKIGVDDYEIITKTTSLEYGVESAINSLYSSLEKLKKDLKKLVL